MHGAISQATIVLVVSLMLAYSTERAAEPPDEPAPSPSSLAVEYAKARLELAQANLKRVESRNKKVANSVSPNVVADYQRDVEVAKLALENATQGESDNFAVWLQRVEAQWKSADTIWKSAVAANKRLQGTIHELDVERLRLRAEMLRINLERGRSLADQPREAQLEWRLSALDDEVEQLSEVVFRTSPVGGSSSRIWYYYYPR